MSPKKTFVTPTRGVGRSDYSMDVSRSISPIANVNQVQVSQASSSLVLAGLPTVPYPFAYWTEVSLSANGAIPAGYTLWGYNLSVSGDTNATTLLGVQIYNEYDFATDTLGTLYKTIFLKFAPKTAELHASKGFNLLDYTGKFLVVLFAHYSANPTINMDLTIHGLVDEELVAAFLAGGV